MKKIRCTLLILLSLLNALFLGIQGMPVHPLPSEPSHVELSCITTANAALTVSCIVPDPTVYEVMRNDQHFTQILLPDEGYTTTIGAAQLPIIRRFIALSSGEQPQLHITSCTWTSYSLADDGLPQHIVPLQPSTMKTYQEGDNEFFLDVDYYAQDTFLPERPVTIVESGSMRGQRFVLVELSPVRYNPCRGELKTMESCTFTLSFTHNDIPPTSDDHRYHSRSFHGLYESLVLNPQDLDIIETPGAEGYLIITHDGLYPAILPFAQWKETQGYTVSIANYSEIPGGGTNQALYHYLQNAYETWVIPPTYVLLVGDVDYIPTFKGEESHTAADYYYTLMDAGPFPDLFLGRFPAATVRQVETMVQKTITYEAADFHQPYVKNVSFLASTDNHKIPEYTHTYIIDTYMIPHNFTCDTFYTAKYDATTEQVIDAINKGRGLLVYSGHGSTTSWADGPPLNQSDISSLTNQDLYPFICSFACVTGDFTVSECFGETWMRAANKGAFAFWGSSAYTFWTEDDYLERYLFAMWWDHNINFTGGITMLALQQLYLHYGGQGQSIYYLECYNLLGDPSAILWRDHPIVADFSYVQMENTDGTTLQFTDQSRGWRTSWTWEFDDGATMNEQHPVYTFHHDGPYTVKLTVTNDENKSDEKEQCIYPISITSPEPGLFLFDYKILTIPRTFLLFSTPKVIVQPLYTGNTSTVFDSLELYVNNELKTVMTQPPYQWLWEEHASGDYQITALAFQDDSHMIATKHLFIITI
jgi:hypothetical protein